jgi:hypothetical protein
VESGILIKAVAAEDAMLLTAASLGADVERELVVVVKRPRSER